MYNVDDALKINETEFTFDIKSLSQSFLPAPEDSETACYGNIVDAIFDVKVDDLDKYDYLIAAASGLVASAIDILWVEEFNLLDAQQWGRKKADEIVVKIANKHGYKGTDVYAAIEKLEKDFELVTDKAKDDFGGAKLHHLNDFSHHPSIIGLSFSILSQFTGYAFGTANDGTFKTFIIEGYDKNAFDITTKIFNGTIKWAYHLVSDMAGSGGTRYSGKSFGMGIPGPLLTALKEISSLPIIKDVKMKYKGGDLEFYKIVQKLYEGAYFKGDSLDTTIHFDLRTEMGIAHKIGKQLVPVIANEVIVRAFYTIRRLCMEIKEKEVTSLSDIKNIDFHRVLPFNNRTIARMMTVSNTTFMAIASTNALIKAAVKSKGNDCLFKTEVLLNLNYPEIGRLAIAIVADAKYISKDLQNMCNDFIEKHREKKRKDSFDIPSELDIEELKKYNKLRNRYKTILSVQPRKIAATAGITVAATALTGGLALTFAPEIAIMLAGETVAGLSGAALTSASLAFVGGGSLAAGGLGMAGGTAIITGGGALLGTATSGAVSALTFTSKDEMINQCATMLTYCKCILIDRENNKEAIIAIMEKINERIDELKTIIENSSNIELDKEGKKQLRNDKECLKLLKKSNVELKKLIK